MRYIILVLVSLFITLQAGEIAVVKTLKGSVYAKSGEKTFALHEGSTLDVNMTLFTKANSLVTIIFKDDSVLNLGQNSVINLRTFVFEVPQSKYDFKLYLKKGSMVFESGKIGDLSPKDFELKTPQGIVAIRGTKFAVKVE
jgi:hypothetical protein